MLGLTQRQLGNSIGVTYQQVHKYVAGLNFIPVGRLHIIAQVLGVEVSYFYQEMTEACVTVEQPAYQRMLLALTRNFFGISNRRHQEALCALALALREKDMGWREADPQAS